MTDLCQANWLCAKVAVFRSIGPPLTPPHTCSFGLSPEFSTPVEKTVEIPRETTRLHSFRADSVRFQLDFKSEYLTK
jgi:hypothetical protein